MRKNVLVSMMVGFALACASASPLSNLYVTGNGIQFLKNRANLAITMMCPDSVASDPVKLAECQQMATDNAIAQASVTEAVKMARVAIEVGDKSEIEIAMAVVTQALCSVQKAVPGIEVDGLDTSDCQ